MLKYSVIIKHNINPANSYGQYNLNLLIKNVAIVIANRQKPHKLGNL